jgi:hypothetical protein
VTSKIGKYELLRKVAKGGSGTVYEARDVLIRRTVALKTCDVKDPEVRARFFQEAQLGGSLRHRNITTVYDFGVEEGTPYIVQEFLDGEDLDRVIARADGLPLIEKLRVLIGVAYGLEYAHNAGVVHRDVKPRNIRVLSDGTVKIMDFGIARLAATGRVHGGRDMGTLAYLAPERILKKPVDARADVFSFGVVAYELLSGRPPFEGATEEELFDRIVREEPPSLTLVAPDVPPVLASIVDGALRKNPEDRYPSIEPVRKALVAALHGLFGRDVPVTIGSGQSTASSPGASSTEGVVGDTREVPAPPDVTREEGRGAQEPVSIEPPPAAAPARRWAGPILACVLVACAAVALLHWRRSRTPTEGSGPPSTSEREANAKAADGRADPAGGARPVPHAGSEPTLPSPSAASDGPPARPPVEVADAPADAQGRKHPPQSQSQSARKAPRPVESPKGESRYARAADEPGLSSDTRAAIYVSGAWEQYRSGYVTSARKMLTAAYTLRKDLRLDPSQYDAGFRRLADRVRGESDRSF